MVYLGEGCLGVGLEGVGTHGVCYPGVLCLGEEREMEREVSAGMVKGQGKPSGYLNQGRVTTAGGKERAAAAGDAGETAACLGSLMRLQGFV